jgi:hypothetical protein
MNGFAAQAEAVQPGLSKTIVSALKHVPTWYSCMMLDYNSNTVKNLIMLHYISNSKIQKNLHKNKCKMKIRFPLKSSQELTPQLSILQDILTCYRVLYYESTTRPPVQSTTPKPISCQSSPCVPDPKPSISTNYWSEYIFFVSSYTINRESSTFAKKSTRTWKKIPC